MQVMILLALGAMTWEALKEGQPIVALIFGALTLGVLRLIFAMEGL